MTEFGPKDYKMRASQILSYLSVTLLLTSFMANAGAIGFDPGLSDGLSGLEAQVHKINNFSKTGKNPLVKIPYDGRKHSFAAIGRVFPLQEVPWKMPDGRIIQTKSLQSTGFLISPCFMVTNYHAVFGASKQPNSKDFSVRFIANREVIAKPVAWGDLDVDDRVKNDWALLEMDEKSCLGLEVGWIKPSRVVDDEQLFKLKVLTAGFPSSNFNMSNPGQLWGDPDCRIYPTPYTPEFSATVLNDCALNHGQSGSPLLVSADNGDLRYVGMQSTDFNKTKTVLRKYNLEHANVAVDLLPVLGAGPMRFVGVDLMKNKIAIEKLGL